MRKLILIILAITTLSLTSCIRQAVEAIPNGCYRFSYPDTWSSDLIDCYMYFWEDGTAEMGYWHSPIYETYFYTWEMSGNDIIFSRSGFPFLTANYSYLKNRYL